MTINEAIIYAEEMAATDGNRKRQDNYNQIAEWLKDYKRMLQQEPVLDKIRAEIADIYCGQYCENPLTADAVREMALEIIDKYTEACEDKE